jgi:uncharacterized membrane protein YfcA
MSTLITTLLLLSGSFAAGLLGSLSGLGGGIVVIPLMALGLGIDIHYAVGTGLIAVIATSTATSCAYVKEGFTNVRAAILLETATTLGAIGGVAIAAFLPAQGLSILFGLYLLYCSATSVLTSKAASEGGDKPDPLAAALQLNGTYHDAGGYHSYFVQRVPLGYGIMLIAGALSGILGIGSGTLKVLALDRAMRLPFKVSTTTSNFMIGVTAAASAGIYLQEGYINAMLTMPVVVGIVAGSFLGARLLPHIKTKTLRTLFIAIITIIGIQMIFGPLLGGEG